MKASEFNRALGFIIQSERIPRMTQTALGNVLGVTFQQVSKSERGINAFSVHQLTLIAAALGVPVEQLIKQALGRAKEAA